MLDWLIDRVPLWVWAVLFLGALAVAWRVLGFKGMLAVLAALVTFGAYRHGRITGADDATRRQKEANDKAVKDYERIKDETGRMDDTRLDDANSPWLRRGR